MLEAKTLISVLVIWGNDARKTEEVVCFYTPWHVLIPIPYYTGTFIIYLYVLYGSSLGSVTYLCTQNGCVLQEFPC